MDTIEKTNNMDYKLAKKLKEAGFPQDGMKVGIARYCYSKFKKEYIKPEGAEVCFTPTLSELVEACGDDFGGLNHNQISEIKYKWHVWRKLNDPLVVIESKSGDHWRDITNVQHFYGNTPEESVANLWLELNKK